MTGTAGLPNGRSSRRQLPDEYDGCKHYRHVMHPTDCAPVAIANGRPYARNHYEDQREGHKRKDERCPDRAFRLGSGRRPDGVSRDGNASWWRADRVRSTAVHGRGAGERGSLLGGRAVRRAAARTSVHDNGARELPPRLRTRHTDLSFPCGMTVPPASLELCVTYCYI